MSKIKIPLITIIWMITMVYSYSTVLPFLVLAILIHEFGHWLFAKLFNVKLKSFELSPLGARIETAHEISYKEEFFLALGGPLLGFISFAVVLPFAHQSNGALMFVVISLCINIFNLLPISTFDGGRILKCLALSVFSLKIAQKIIAITSFLTAFSLWLLSVYMLIKIGAGLSMLIFCSIFFAKRFIFNTKNGDFKSF